MLTTRQYADLNGYNHNTVYKWCQKGLISNTVKVPNTKTGSGFMYLIPENAAPPPHTNGRPRSRFGEYELTPKQSLSPSPVAQLTKREINLFIRRHCKSMTYGDMSRALGIPTLKLREMYDYLHNQYGI